MAEPVDRRLINAARIDPAVFIDLFIWLVPAGGGTPERFRLWDFQDQVLLDLQEQTNIVVLKARQLGLSWVALAYALWLAICNPGQTVLILNRNLSAAIDLLDRVRFMHKHLPDELKARVIQDSNASSMPVFGFANGSRIISLPGTEDAGTGLTAQLIIADEVSKWSWPRATFTSILATLAGGGTLIAISTAKGLGNYYAELWAGAQPGAEKPNGYFPIFIPSSAHPARDEEWLAAEALKYPDLRKFHQEHPETPSDAFQLADEAVFTEFDRSEHHAEYVREPQWPMWRGIDFGYHHAVCYWIEIQGDRIAHVAGELHVQKGTTDELAGQIVLGDAGYGLAPSEAPAGVDPAGKARTSQSGTMTDHDTLHRHGVSDLRTIEPSAPSDRVDLIKRLLREGRLLIDCTACPRLAEALEQAQWETRRAPTGEMIPGETYAKDGLHEHFLDALGYGLANVWPEGGGLVIAPGPTPKATPRRRYSQSEFG